MSPEIYAFDLSRATKPIDLFALRETIKADDSLHADEKDELLAAISVKIEAAAETRKFKGRWD